METKQSMITGKIKYAFGALKSFIMDNHGDTMIEILIAFTMLTICLGTLTGILSFASKMIQMSKDQDVAQAQYDEESAKIFSSDTAYDKEPISLLTYSFNGIFSMDLNSASVDVKDKTLNIFSTSGEDSSSYIKSLSVDNIAAPTQFGDNEVIFPKTTLEASITRVNNNTSKTEELNDEEKRSLTITLTSDAKAAGISLSEDKEAGTFTINYPSTVAGNEYSLNAAYPTGTSPVSCNFNVLFGPIEGKIEKSVTLFADTSAERSSLGFGSTAKESVQVEFNKDSDKVTSDWDDLVGPDGSNTLFVAIGYEFKGWVLCDSEGEVKTDKNGNEIIITGTGTDKVDVYNIEDKMKEYIFDPNDTETTYYFKAKVEEVSSGAMLCTDLQSRINNDLTGKAEVSIKRETKKLTDTSDWTRVDIANQNPGDTLNGKKLSNLYTTPIWMKYEGETLWWYSEANTIFLAPVSYDELFNAHSSLKSVDGLSYWDASYITSFKKGFFNCGALESAEGVSNWKCYNVTNVSSCFQNCTSLESAEGVSNWKCYNVTDISSCFQNCTSLKGVVNLNWDLSQVTTIQNMFNGDSKITKLENDYNYSSRNSGKLNNRSGVLTGCTSLESIGFFKHLDVSNIENISSMFSGLTSLKDISAVADWDTSKVTNMSSCFQNCTSLAELEPLKNWDTSSVTNFSNIFNGCTSIEVIDGDLDGWKFNSAITNVTNIFSGMTNLETLEVDWSEDGSMPGVTTFEVKSNTTGLFQGHTSLKNVVLKWNAPNLTSVFGMFQNCSNLETVELDIPRAKITNGNFIFKNCSSLKTAAVNVDFSNLNFGQFKDVFMGCKELISATNNCSANYSIDSNGNRKPLIKPDRFVNMFKGCVNLTDASFAKYLNFEKCNEPNNGNGNDHSHMFNECTKLTADHLSEIMATWDLNNKSFEGKNDSLDTTASQDTTFTDYNGNNYSLESGKLIKQ